MDGEYCWRCVGCDVKMCDEDLKLEDTCVVCNKRLLNGVPCTDHGDNVKHYECLFCNVNFSRQASLMWHLKTVHDYKLNINPNKSLSISEHNYYERPTCTKCKVKLQNAYEMENHLCGNQRNKLIEPSVTQHSKAKKSIESVVIQPNKATKSVESAVTHSNKVIKSVESPVTHPNKTMKSVESQPDKEKKAAESSVTHCITCNKDFTSEDAYRKHLSKYVTKYRPFYCCICQTTFSRKRSLVFHLYIHKRSSEPESKVSRLADIPDPPRAYPFVSKSKLKKTAAKEEVETKEGKIYPCISKGKSKSTPEKEVEAEELRAHPYVNDPKTGKTPAKEEVETKEPKTHPRVPKRKSKSTPVKEVEAEEMRAHPYVHDPKMRKTPYEEIETEEPLMKLARISAEISKATLDKPVPKDEPQIIDVRNNVVINQKCTICQKKFKKVLDLEKHLISYHHASLVHKCSLCPEGFVLKASLMNHAIKHIF